MKASKIKCLSCLSTCNCGKDKFEIVISPGEDLEGNFFNEEPENLHVSHYSFNVEPFNASKHKLCHLSANTAQSAGKSTESQGYRSPLLRRLVSEYAPCLSIERTKKLLMDMVLEEAKSQKTIYRSILNKRKSTLL